MPPINHLNQPPNPFWDFVADMQDHPFFAAYAPQSQPEQPRNAGPAPTNDQPQQQSVNAEDPPEVDPTTLRSDAEQTQETRGPRCRGRRRCGSGSDEEGDRRRDWHGRRPHGRRGHFGPGSGPFGQAGFNPFAGLAGGPPFWAAPNNAPPPPPFGPGPHGRGGFHHRGGPPHHHHGPPPHGPFHHGPHHRPGHGPHGRRSPSPPSPPRGPPGGFDVGKFLNDLGSRLGLDLSGAAEGLGLDQFLPTHTSPDVDFEPKADIFDRPEDYVVHLSLPGAKKSDVGVDWDGEHSLLRIAGVVHRPGVDETMLGQLVVDGRKRETGVFEKSIRLGTRRDPASIDVSGIKAKMADGVLAITVPKLQKQPDKRDVPIAKSQTPSPARNEKQVIFDVDQEMVEAEPEAEIQLVDRTTFEQSQKGKGKQAEHEEHKSRESSATVDAEPEQLPAYHPVQHQEGSDWEHFGSDDEGDYIKINVD